MQEKKLLKNKNHLINIPNNKKFILRYINPVKKKWLEPGREFDVGVRLKMEEDFQNIF